MAGDLRKSNASVPRNNDDESDSDSDSVGANNTECEPGYEKIVASFLVGGLESLSASTREKSRNIADSYGDNFVCWVWGPNASDHHALDPPSGFSLTVRPSSPVHADSFHPEKLFRGTAAFCLDGATFRNGSPITLDRLINDRSRLKARLNEAVLECSDRHALPPQLTQGASVDASAWKEALGVGDGSYAGIFSSTERGAHRYDTRYWLVVQSGFASVSEQLYRRMESTGKDTTWDEFFFKDPTTLQALSYARRNRARLLFRVAEALDLDVGTASKADTRATRDGPASLIEPSIQTVSHTVVKNREGNIVYHSNSIDPQSGSQQGILFNENPLLGPVVLKGPPMEGKRAGLSWTGSKDGRGLFPSCTGRRSGLKAGTASLRARDSDRNEELRQPTAEELAPFVWEGSAPNLRLCDDVYRARDANFKSVEAKLGYDHAWGEIQLRPSVVKVASAQ